MNSWNNTVSDAAVTFNGGVISIGTDAVASAINIGTVTARTVTIGNITGASALPLKCGTGDFTLASATGTVLKALDTGEITRSIQPAFSAYLGATVNDKTGTGTSYTLGTDALTEVFDQGGDFNVNGTFTAPVTGRYILYGTVYLSGCTIVTTMGTSIVTSNRNYGSFGTKPAADNFQRGLCAICDMDAADTAVCSVYSSGEAADTDDVQGGNFFSGFAGYLFC